MTHQKNYRSIDEYIQHATIANENGPASAEIFDEAITILQQMKQMAASTNVVDISGSGISDISSEEYDELIEWLESLDNTRH